MKRILITLCCMLFWLWGYSQNNSISYADKYLLNLDATITKDTTSYRFITNVASTRLLGISPVRSKDGNYGEEFTPNPLYSCMKKIIRRRILLPDLPDKKTGHVSLRMKGDGLKQVSMRIQGLDCQETVLFGDTLAFVPDTVYSQLYGDYPLDDIEMLDITIDIEGKNNQASSFVFSGLEIKVDGKIINDMPFRILPEVAIDSKRLVPISDDADLPFGKMKALQGKKIIGLGESLHHHKDVNRLAFRLMEEGVRALGCRVLVIEMPIETSLFFNRYLSDDSFVLPERLLDKPAVKEYVPLLDSLRHYNGTCSPDERVMLLGMDYNTRYDKENNPLSDLFDFVSELNKERTVKEADLLSLALYDNKPEEAMEHLRLHRQELGKVLTIEEQKCMEHILSSSMGLSRNTTERVILRDSMMAENLTFIERNFAPGKEDRIMVYGHSIHLNRLSVYPVDNYRSAGSYLQERYGSLYAPFLLVTDGGSHYYTLANIVMDTKLLAPCHGSIEQALAHGSKTSCYLPISKEYDSIVFSRLMLNPSLEGFNFYPSNLFQRYDGVFYVKAELALHASSERTNEEMIKELEKILDKYERMRQEKKALADEIRKRCG